MKGILEKFGMDNSKPISTPVDVSARLAKARDDDEKIDQTQYQSAVGSLLFLSTRTRPDIAYAVSTILRRADKRALDSRKAHTALFEWNEGLRSALQQRQCQGVYRILRRRLGWRPRRS